MTDILLGSVFLIGLILGLTALVVAARRLLMPERPVTLTLNGRTQLRSHSGRKLLGALTENGVLIPSACAGAGTCGLCRVTLPGDAPPHLPVEKARLTRTDLREGVHLACQVVVRGDMAVEVDEAFLDAERQVLTVASARQLTPLIREIVLDASAEGALTVQAGSFLQVTAPPFALDFKDIAVPAAFEDDWQLFRGLSLAVPSETTRAYSLANRPQDTKAGHLVLNIRLALPPPSRADAPPGVVSSWLFSLSAGDSVAVSGPFGTFRVQDSAREMVFVGGGVGMAPLRAMIFEQLQQRRTTRKMSFWYGARSEADLYYASEFDALAETHPNFDWTVALSEPASGASWTGAVGFVHTVAFEQYLRDHPAPEACEYYLCGPPMMMRAVLGMLDDLGVEPDHIFCDDFGV